MRRLSWGPFGPLQNRHTWVQIPSAPPKIVGLTGHPAARSNVRPVGAQDSWSDVPDLAGEQVLWLVRAPDGRQTSVPASVSQIAKSLEVGKLSADFEVRHIRSTQWESIGAFLARMRPSLALRAAVPITASAFPPLTHVSRVSGSIASRAPVGGTTLGGLLDPTFTKFFTPKIVGVLYGAVILVALLTLLAGAISGLSAIASAFATSRNGPSGLAVLFGVARMAGGVVGAALIVVLGRVALEVVVATFRISETLTEIKTKLR
jgi:Domain of unknown function (DUF4282)